MSKTSFQVLLLAIGLFGLSGCGRLMRALYGGSFYGQPYNGGSHYGEPYHVRHPSYKSGPLTGRGNVQNGDLHYVHHSSQRSSGHQTGREKELCKNFWWHCRNARNVTIKRICVKYEPESDPCVPIDGEDKILQRCSDLEYYTDNVVPTSEICKGRTPRKPELSQTL